MVLARVIPGLERCGQGYAFPQGASMCHIMSKVFGGFDTKQLMFSPLFFAPSEIPGLPLHLPRLTAELNSVWVEGLMFGPILFLITPRTNLE